MPGKIDRRQAGTADQGNCLIRATIRGLISFQMSVPVWGRFRINRIALYWRSTQGGHPNAPWSLNSGPLPPRMHPRFGNPPAKAVRNEGSSSETANLLDSCYPVCEQGRDGVCRQDDGRTIFSAREIHFRGIADVRRHAANDPVPRDSPTEKTRSNFPSSTRAKMASSNPENENRTGGSEGEWRSPGASARS